MRGGNLFLWKDFMSSLQVLDLSKILSPNKMTIWSRYWKWMSIKVLESNCVVCCFMYETTYRNGGINFIPRSTPPVEKSFSCFTATSWCVYNGQHRYKCWQQLFIKPSVNIKLVNKLRKVINILLKNVSNFEMRVASCCYCCGRFFFF